MLDEEDAAKWELTHLGHTRKSYKKQRHQRQLSMIMNIAADYLWEGCWIHSRRKSDNGEITRIKLQGQEDKRTACKYGHAGAGRKGAARFSAWDRSQFLNSGQISHMRVTSRGHETKTEIYCMLTTPHHNLCQAEPPPPTFRGKDLTKTRSRGSLVVSWISPYSLFLLPLSVMDPMTTLFCVQPPICTWLCVQLKFFRSGALASRLGSWTCCLLGCGVIFVFGVLSGMIHCYPQSTLNCS